MTITTHARVQRGYYRAYYERTAETRRQKAREGKKCRCRRGWAKWLIAELIAYWYAEATGHDQPTLDAILFYQPTSDQWMSYASDGLNRRSIGSRERQIRSTG
jgi:hypothetical protein